MVIARCLVFFPVLLVLLTACGRGAAPVPTYKSLFFAEQGEPVQPLKQLLASLGVAHANTRESVIQATQKQWLRAPGTERFELLKQASGVDAVRPLLRELGVVDEVLPQRQQYEYALVHGGTILAMRARLAFLAKLWLHGVRFKRLVLLTGQRDLSPQHESLSDFTNFQDQAPMQPGWQPTGQEAQPQTEADAMRIIYHHQQLPPAMRALPVTVADAPKQQLPDGSWRRPNTKDTMHAWLACQPEAGSCLAVSSQPFVLQQDLDLKTVLPAGFTVETVGFAMPPAFESLAIYLDSLARAMYQERAYLGSTLSS